ncbi:MAG: hypothetical protein QF552_09800 [Litorilituus sp.]|nr:hypothetical protein [Litorilituus sp.]
MNNNTVFTNDLQQLKKTLSKVQNSTEQYRADKKTLTSLTRLTQALDELSALKLFNTDK